MTSEVRAAAGAAGETTGLSAAPTSQSCFKDRCGAVDKVLRTVFGTYVRKKQASAPIILCGGLVKVPANSE